MGYRRSVAIDKKTARKARRLMFFSVVVLVLLVFFGTTILAGVSYFLGNLSGDTRVDEHDKTPPTPPNFVEITEITKDGSVKISGLAEVGSTVRLYLDDQLIYETKISDNSRFLKEIKVEKGEHKLVGTATDLAGNLSGETSRYKIIYDVDPPMLEINTPTDGSYFSGNEEQSIVIYGLTDPDSKVTVGERLATMDKDGNFKVTYSLSEGVNELKFVATDKAENKTEKIINVNYLP